MLLDRKAMDHWLALDAWSMTEAALIFAGIHPEATKGRKINMGARPDTLPVDLQEAGRIRQIFSRAKLRGYVGYYNAAPVDFLNLADAKGIEFPEVLLDAMTAIAQRSKATVANSGQTEPELKEAERQSLYKIIIGLAVGAYAYTPDKRNARLSEMLADIERAGVNVDADTLRKWLKAASTVLPGRS